MEYHKHHEGISVIQPDLIHTQADVSTTLFDLSTRTSRVVDGAKSSALIIGTHPHIPLVGVAMVSPQFFRERTSVVDTPNEVLARLRQLVNVAYQKYSVVMAAFESHHFRGRDLQDFVELLAMLSHGTVIMGDYAFAGIANETARLQSNSDVEKRQQKLYGGFEPWIQEHRVFTVESFIEATRNAGWKSFQGFTMPNNKVGMIASSTLNSDELSLISHPASHE